MDLLNEIKSNWNDQIKLSEIQLDVVGKQIELAESIAAEEAQFNSAYLSEHESAWKATDSIVKARAKALVGGNKTRYEYEFQAYTNLLNVVISRISQLREKL